MLQINFFCRLSSILYTVNTFRCVVSYAKVHNMYRLLKIWMESSNLAHFSKATKERNKWFLFQIFSFLRACKISALKLTLSSKNRLLTYSTTTVSTLAESTTEWLCSLLSENLAKLEDLVQIFSRRYGLYALDPSLMNHSMLSGI